KVTASPATTSSRPASSSERNSLAAPAGAMTRAPCVTVFSDRRWRWSMCRCEISTTSTGSIVGTATRRRRWTTRLVRIGSVSTRKPSTSNSTVAWPTQGIVTSGCIRTSAMDRVQIVVDGDPADAHCVGDVLHRPSQDEGTLLVEQAHGALLVLSRERRQRAAELGLDGVDQTIERTV